MQIMYHRLMAMLNNGPAMRSACRYRTGLPLACMGSHPSP
jgi:hypothetical protein